MSSLIIIDGNFLLYRSWYSTLKWFPNKNYNAVWQSLKTIDKLIKDYKPAQILIVFDSKKSFRDDLQKDYKAGRKKMPQIFYNQFPKLKKKLKERKIPSFAREGYEGDDLLGIFSKKIYNKYELIYLVTCDKDICQLIDEKIKIINPNQKWKLLDEQYVKERYKVEPKQMADYLALVGDKADNIEGLEGVGPKKAAKLLNKYNNIETIVELPKYKKYKERLLFSKKMTTILTEKIKEQ